MAARGWGYWTEAKLDILSAYLPAFASASVKAGTVVYLDLFAGNEENQRRDTGTDIKGSAVRALEALPPQAGLYLFELPRVAVALKSRLSGLFPHRTFEVVEGDSNQKLDDVLQKIRTNDLAWAPMFAYIDPYSTSTLQWDALRRLSDFKRDRKYKVELWLLFYGSDIPRVLGQRESDNASKVTRTFGCDDWRPIAQDRDEGKIDPARARYEYTNLMRWRLQHVLGYERTHALEIKNISGSYLYDLIFATDNAAGDRIMGDIYRKALARNERMRLEAVEMRRDRRSGQPSLFGAAEIGKFATTDMPEYRADAPTPPYGGETDLREVGDM